VYEFHSGCPVTSASVTLGYRGIYARMTLVATASPTDDSARPTESLLPAAAICRCSQCRLVLFPARPFPQKDTGARLWDGLLGNGGRGRWPSSSCGSGWTAWGVSPVRSWVGLRGHEWGGGVARPPSSAPRPHLDRSHPWRGWRSLDRGGWSAVQPAGGHRASCCRLLFNRRGGNGVR